MRIRSSFVTVAMKLAIRLTGLSYKIYLYLKELFFKLKKCYPIYLSISF